MKALLVTPLLTTTLAVAAALTLPDAYGHGSTKPEHGGFVRVVGETVFELVPQAKGADVYLKEEDEKLDTADMSGKLTVTLNNAKSEAALVPAGGNKLTARDVSVPSGAKVTVFVTRKDQTKLGATFQIE
jgi:hypothetical protein